MPTDFSTIDLATLNAAQGVMVAALRDRCCQWEQDSADAAAGGNLSAAAMIQHWAFAADLLSTTISTEFTNLLSQAPAAEVAASSCLRRAAALAGLGLGF